MWPLPRRSHLHEEHRKKALSSLSIVQATPKLTDRSDKSTSEALSEALSIGESLGGDPMQLSDVYSASSGKGFVVDTYSPVPHYREGTPASKGYNGGFMVKLLHKDLGLAVQAA